MRSGRTWNVARANLSKGDLTFLRTDHSTRTVICCPEENKHPCRNVAYCDIPYYTTVHQFKLPSCFERIFCFKYNAVLRLASKILTSFRNNKQAVIVFLPRSFKVLAALELWDRKCPVTASLETPSTLRPGWNRTAKVSCPSMQRCQLSC